MGASIHTLSALPAPAPVKGAYGALRTTLRARYETGRALVMNDDLPTRQISALTRRYNELTIKVNRLTRTLNLPNCRGY